MAGSCNKTRAKWASVIVGTYKKITFEENDMAGTISDLLTDIMHLCDREEIDFSTILARSIERHNDEKSE